MLQNGVRVGVWEKEVIIEMEEILARCWNDISDCFPGPSNTDALILRVNEIIPIEENGYKIVNVVGTVAKFKTVLHAKVRSAEEFIEEYNRKNNETLRLHTKNRNSTYYRCKHNTRYEKTRDLNMYLDEKPSARIKNTNCKFSLSMKALNECADFNTTITIEWNHNHSTTSLHSLTFNDISPNTKYHILKLFQDGLLPGAAHKELMRQLRSECKVVLEYEEKLADRSIIPRRPDMNRIYGQYTKEMYGSTNISSMFGKLEEKIEELKETSIDYEFRMVKYNEEESQPFILIVVTPLMKRVHQMVPNAKDLVFIDSSSNMEEFNLRVFIIVTHSVCGALPLGIIVTSDEQRDTLTQAFELFKESISSYGFFNSTEIGPHVIMTDNCDELREALLSAWPRATLLLCIYHILQQVWRWIHEAKNGIALGKRPHILTLFKDVLYANTVDDMKSAYERFSSDDIITMYPNLIAYIASVYEDNSAWALCHRKDLPIRGNNTNNFCEAQFMVIKDDILKRQKEVNIVGLLDKLTKELDQHYKNKLLSISSGKYDGIYSRRFNAQGKEKGKNARKTSTGFQVPSREVQEKVLTSTVRLGNSTFLMDSLTSDNVKYLVDMNSGMCECSQGMNGSPYKHQYIICVNKLCDSLNFIPRFSPLQKQRFSDIALGCSLNIERYEGLHDRVTDSQQLENDCSLMDSGPSTSHPPRPHPCTLTPMQRRNRNIDDISLDEAFSALDKASETLKKRLKNEHQQCLRGIMKFSERVTNYPISRLTSGFQAFATPSISSTKITASSILKNVKSRKIHVQPTAVQRRKNACGSRNKCPKGQKSKNAFKPKEQSKKRAHSFANNVLQNVPAPKKAGRSMNSKTRIISKRTVPKPDSSKPMVYNSRGESIL